MECRELYFSYSIIINQLVIQSFPFGYTHSDGFRGHVIVSPSNDTIVLSIKGTTIQGPTSAVDKQNDNLYVGQNY